jgi:hypothetical protein
VIPCEHWSAPGLCAIKKYGERPSPGSCHICLGLPPAPPPLVKLTVVPNRKVEGPKRWAELHRRALAWDGTGDREAELKFIRTLADGLGGCACKRTWAKLLKGMPPDLSTGESYWRWSWQAHRAVNRSLKKPELSEQEARTIWQQP